jgi:hypothetical protein
MRAAYLPATGRVATKDNVRALVLRSLAHFTPVDYTQWREVDALFRSKRPAQEIVDSLEHMLANGLPLNAKQSGGAAGPTLIEHAAIVQCEPALLHLLKKDPTLVSAAGTTFQACRMIPSAIAYLLNSGFTLEREVDRGARLVELFFNNGNAESLKLLAGAGMDLDIRFSRGGSRRRAIEHCVLSLPPEFLEAFVAGGAKLHEVQRGEYSLYHLAVDDHFTKPSRRLDAPEPIELFRARVKILKDAGLPIDIANEAGETALHFALKRGYVNKAIALLEMGADPELLDKKGRTAVKLARACRRKDAAEKFAHALAAQRAMAAIKRATAGAASPTPAP